MHPDLASVESLSSHKAYIKGGKVHLVILNSRKADVKGGRFN